MTDNRTNEQLAERLRQFAESQAMDFDNPHIAMTLNEVADRLTGGQLSGSSGQFTDEQVEAAAKAICETRPHSGGGSLVIYEDAVDFARAALVAAQGAAPQLIGRLDLARHYWRSQGYDYDLHGQDGNNDYEMGLAVADAALAALADAQGAAPQAESECLCYGADGVTEPKCPTCLTAECDRDGMGICKRCGMGWDARKVLDGDFACPVLPSSGVDEDALAEVLCEKNYVSPDGLPFCSSCRDEARNISERRAAWLKEGAK